MEYRYSKFIAMDEMLVDQVLDRVKKIEEPRWSLRKSLEGRSIEGSTCHYWFCGNAQMTKDDVEFLKSIAPTFDNYWLKEIAVNKYNVGDFIGKHKDKHYYRKNMVIALQDLGDSLYFDDLNETIPDVKGQAVVLDGIGPAHSVPPVKNQRYSLIYLYE
jgi:hypothetical protein